MTRLAKALGELVAALPADAPAALVGGLAVSVRTEPRFTRDIDLAVAADDAGAEAVVRALVFRGYATESVLENTRLQRLATIRLKRTAGAHLDE